MSILIDLCKKIFLAHLTKQTSNTHAEATPANKVLNVGGSSKLSAIPIYFSGWQHDLLDIDPRGNPDILCDAREITGLPGGAYNAVYCSHNLEHYYRHHGIDVVRGFFHVLKEDGFAEIRVPDVSQVLKALNDQQLELDEPLYDSPAGPITAHDIIYGLQSEIIDSGQDFFSHKTGFTPKSLAKILKDGGFFKVFLRTDNSDDQFSVHALAFKAEPTKEQYLLFENTWQLKAAHYTPN
jgi:predicted SAM-dependent methyltransferase